MAWDSEINLTPGMPDPSHQTDKNSVGYVETDWTGYLPALPCVRALFDFTPPYNQVGAEANVYLRRASATSWLRNQVKLKTGNRFDFSIVQNFGTDLSQDPNLPLYPFTQVNRSGPHAPGAIDVSAIEEDGSGGWYVAGEFHYVTDETGTPILSGFNSVIHIDNNGVLDTNFQVTTNGPVYALKRFGTSLFIGGSFTEIDVAGNYGGPYNERRLAWVNGTTGAPVDVGFNIDNGQVDAIEIIPSGPFAGVVFGGTFTSVNGVSKSYIARADISGTPTHDPVWTLNPSINGRVRALLEEGDGLWVGGDFGLGGFSDTADGLCKVTYPGILEKKVKLRIDPLFFFEFPGQCYTLKAANGILYVGGRFEKVRNGAGSTVGTRNNAAAINLNADDTDSGFVTSWNPNCNDTVRALEVTDANIIIGGDFTTIGTSGRQGVAEVDPLTAEVKAWDPGLSPTPIVAAIGWDAGTARRLIGGYFTQSNSIARSSLASYQALPATGIDTIFEATDIPLPPSRKISVMSELHCGNLMKTWLMDGETGRLIKYKQRVVSWTEDNTARVEIGPAGIQGPQIEDASLNMETGLTCLPIEQAFTPCASPPTSLQHFTSTHLPEAYPAIISNTTYTAPRGWAEGVNGLNPPNQRPARWWHEIVQPGEDAGGPATPFMATADPPAELELRGDLIPVPNHFSHDWCLGIIDVRGHPSGYLNSDDDPVSQRWFNILIAGTKQTTGDTVKFTGLSVRVDYKRSAIAIGWTEGAGVTKRAAQRRFRNQASKHIDVIHQGTFDPRWLPWTILDNLDQWTEGLSFAVSMDCNNDLTVDVYGTRGLLTVLLRSITVTLATVGQSGTLNTEEMGDNWGCFAFMEGVNQAALDDDENSKIMWNELQADLGDACVEE